MTEFEKLIFFLSRPSKLQLQNNLVSNGGILGYYHALVCKFII